MVKGTEFLPVSRDEMIHRGWYYYDFLVVTADGYIDHPSFGSAIIARLLESEGYRVAVLAQPDWRDAEAFRAMGKPRYGVLIGGGNLDSMVAHYTVAKRRRTQDLYSNRAAASYAFLGAGTDYHLNFYTGNFSASLRFDDSDAVIEIFLSARH